MIRSWLKFQMRHSVMLFASILVIIGLFGYYGTQLKIDPGLEALISPDSEYNVNERILVNAFGQRDVMVVLVKEDRNSIISNRPRSMQDSSLETYYEELEETLLESQYVDSVTGPTYNSDSTYARFLVNMRVPDNVDGYSIVEAELKTLIAEIGEPPGIRSELTGFALLVDRIPALLISDSLKTMMITLGMVLIILLFYFNNFRLAVVALSTPLLSIIILAGALVLLNIDVTVTLAAVGVFIIGLGVDYGIHISIHYQNARKKGLEPKKALVEIMEKLWLPVTASFLTTLAGFSALILGYSPSSQSQGIVLAFGILIIYVMSMIFVPVLLNLFAHRATIKPNDLFDSLTTALTKLAIFQSRRPKTVLAVIGILTVVMFIGMTQVKFSTSNSNWIPDDDPLSLSFREIAWQYGDTSTIAIVLEAQTGDLRNVLTVKDAQRLTEVIKKIPSAEIVQSPFDGMPLGKTEIHEAITNDRAEFFNKDFRLTTIRIISENFGQDEEGKSEALKEIRQAVKEFSVHNTKISLWGDMVRFDELGDSLQQDAQQTTMIGFVLVFLVASLVYSSIVVGLSALIPIIIAIIWAVGMMGYFNVPFTSLSTGIVSLVLGIGSDFSIHLVDGVKRNVARGFSMEKALYETLHNTGSPILLSSLTTLFGFLALTGATLLGTQRLGLSLAFAIISVFIVVVCMVPAIMSLNLRKQIKQQNNTKKRKR